MKKALVLVFSNLKHDSRVKRQIGFLCENFQVTVVAFDGEPKGLYTLIKIKQTPLTFLRKAVMAVCLALRLFKPAYRLFHDYRQTEDSLKKESFDLIVANDIDALPMAFAIKGTSPAHVLFDAHEYAPRHFEDRILWRLFFQPFYIHLCKKYIPMTAAMLTVGKGLAKEYETHFGKKPVVITNAPHYSDIQPSKVLPDKIRLVHHGIANPSRRLELMQEMMHHLDDRFTLDLYLMTSDFASGKTKSYIDQLKKSFEQDARIKIHPPLPSHEIVSSINQYDMGVFLLPPVNFNYANTLPNKFFEFIQARLAIAIGPTPEMAELTRQFSNGVVSDDFNPIHLARELSSLTEETLTKMKQNSALAAKSLCAEKNKEIFLDTLKELPL